MLKFTHYYSTKVHKTSSLKGNVRAGKRRARLNALAGVTWGACMTSLPLLAKYNAASPILPPATPTHPLPQAGGNAPAATARFLISYLFF